MRKIEEKMLQALKNGGYWQMDNTMVCGNAVSLHGNHIASMVDGKCEINLNTLSRFPTRTTKSRLRALGANLTTRAGVIYLDGVDVFKAEVNRDM